jgi:hypothetical protein
VGDHEDKIGHGIKPDGSAQPGRKALDDNDPKTKATADQRTHHHDREGDPPICLGGEPERVRLAVLKQILDVVVREVMERELVEVDSYNFAVLARSTTIRCR